MTDERLAQLMQIAPTVRYSIQVAARNHDVPCQLCNQHFSRGDLFAKNTCWGRVEMNLAGGQGVHVLKACMTCFDAHCVQIGAIEEEV